MSAEYLKRVKERFATAYHQLLADTRGSWMSKPKNEGHLHTMKVEFDAVMALLYSTEAEADWVRSVLADNGYSGPLTETSCPLREWLNPSEPVPMPSGKFTEYVIDYEDKGRFTFFVEAEALDEMRKACAHGDKFEFSTDEFRFEDEWRFAQSMLKQGQPLSKSSLHALKLGLAAGMKIEL